MSYQQEDSLEVPSFVSIPPLPPDTWSNNLSPVGKLTRELPAGHTRAQIETLEMWKRRVFTLRARMLVFVQQLLYFCTAEVIEPNWQALMAKLNAKEHSKDGTSPVRTVDELMQDHVDFLDTCLKECMLTNSRLLRVSIQVFATMTLLRVFLDSFEADADMHILCHIHWLALEGTGTY